jgi:hypothetical protein
MALLISTRTTLDSMAQCAIGTHKSSSEFKNEDLKFALALCVPFKKTKIDRLYTVCIFFFAFSQLSY